MKKMQEEMANLSVELVKLKQNHSKGDKASYYGNELEVE